MQTRNEIPLPIINSTSSGEQLVNDLTLQLDNYITQMFKNETITTSNILIIISDIMQIVEHYSSLEGANKKRIVLNLITNQINISTNLSSDTKAALLLMVQTVAPAFIDTIIRASNGLLDLNKNCKCC